MCGVLGHLALIHRCVRSVCYVACAVSWATWLLFTGVHPRPVVLRVRPPGPPGPCTRVCTLHVLCFVCRVQGHLAPVHRCVCWLCSAVCAVSWATWLLFTGVNACCVLLCVRCPGPLGSRSPVFTLGVFCCVCGVLGLFAAVYRCVPSMCCAVGVMYWATWLLFTGVYAECVVFRVWCPGPLGSCSPVCTLGILSCVCRVLGHLAPVHQCARSACCVACAVSWTTWLLFIGVHARCVLLCVPCLGPLASCSAVCTLGVFCRVCGVPGTFAAVQRCVRSVCCAVRAVSKATWLLFTSVYAQCVVFCVFCPGPHGSCSPVCTLGVFLLCVLCPPPLGSCSPLCTLGVLCCVCGVLGHVAPDDQCARSPCCGACAVSWATWHLSTGVHARCVVLRLRSPGPHGSC